tara:strand:+ start:465 stop:650 length:186 start_codon:yes stop_codon:yes gene_type:complete
MSEYEEKLLKGQMLLARKEEKSKDLKLRYEEKKNELKSRKKEERVEAVKPPLKSSLACPAE